MSEGGTREPRQSVKLLEQGGFELTVPVASGQSPFTGNGAILAENNTPELARLTRDHRNRRFLDDLCWHFARLVCGSNDPLGWAEQLKTKPKTVQGVCLAIGSDTARSARGARNMRWSRQAYRLGHACQREDRFNRLQRRAAMLNRQLGGAGWRTWDTPPGNPNGCAGERMKKTRSGSERPRMRARNSQCAPDAF